MESKNLFLAFALSMAVLLGWGWMFPPQKPVQVAPNQLESPATPSASSNTVDNRNVSDAASQPSQHTNSLASDSPAITNTSIKTFGNDVLSLTINAKGWIRSAALTAYQESLKNASKVHVLTTDEYR